MMDRLSTDLGTCDMCGSGFTAVDGTPTKIRWETGHGKDKWICVPCADRTFSTLDFVNRMVFCHGHGKYESAPAYTFRICGECEHVYETAKDLLDLYNREGAKLHARTFNEEGGFEMGEWQDKTKVAEIQFCPVCMHDF